MLFIKNNVQKKIAIIAIALFVVLGCLLTYIYLNSPNKPLEGKQVCGPEVIQAANHALEKDSGKELAEIGAKVKATKHYETDVNCMYIALRYDLRFSSLEEVNKTFNTFEAIYKPEVLSKSFGAQFKSTTELKGMIASREKLQASVRQNMKIIDEPQNEK
jgi:hypothetical protein